MKSRVLLQSLLFSMLVLSVAAQAAAPKVSKATLERGRYLVVTGGCNDCHTPGYPDVAGKIPTSKWLTGNPVGFQGPWGTSYPANLRLKVQSMTEAQFLARARQPLLPPMPWFNLRDMKDSDVVAIYQFIRSLGPAGEPVPPAAAPGVAVSTPYIVFVPQNLPPQQAQAKH